NVLHGMRRSLPEVRTAGLKEITDSKSPAPDPSCDNFLKSESARRTGRTSSAPPPMRRCRSPQGRRLPGSKAPQEISPAPAGLFFSAHRMREAMIDLLLPSSVHLLLLLLILATAAFRPGAPGGLRRWRHVLAATAAWTWLASTPVLVHALAWRIE